MKEWNDIRKELYTPEEIRECDLRVDIISTFINARNEGKITQLEFERLIERFENIAYSKSTNAQDNASADENISPLDAVLNMIAPFGKTLAVAPARE